VVVQGDGGGRAQAIGKPLAGRQRVARLLVVGLRRGRTLGASLRLAWVNGQPGGVMYDAEGRGRSGRNWAWGRACKGRRPVPPSPRQARETPPPSLISRCVAVRPAWPATEGTVLILEG
jgi:hypothetical protein